MAAAIALANLAREPVPKEVKRAYHGQNFEFGPDYIMPTPFDPRLIDVVPRAVAQAAMDSGEARVMITDWHEYHFINKLRTEKTNF